MAGNLLETVSAGEHLLIGLRAVIGRAVNEDMLASHPAMAT
jgi:hypothetical protein